VVGEKAPGRHLKFDQVARAGSPPRRFEVGNTAVSIGPFI